MELSPRLWILACVVVAAAGVFIGVVATSSTATALPFGESAYSKVDRLGILWMQLDRRADVVKGELGGTYLTNQGIATFRCNGVGTLSGSTLSFPRLSGSEENCTHFDARVSANGNTITASAFLVFSSVSTGRLKAQETQVQAMLKHLLAEGSPAPSR